MAYSTVKLVEAELRTTTEFSSSTNPTLLTVENWIDEADSYIDATGNRIYGISDYEDKLHYDGEPYLFVKHSPLLEVTTLSYNSAVPGDAEAWTVLTEDTNYIIDKDKGMIILITSSFTPKDGYNRFKVAYASGYDPLPFNIQSLSTKMVTLRVLNSLITQNVNERNDGGSISVGDISIVEPTSYGVGSYKQLKDDIKDLESSLVGGFRVYRYG